MTWSWLYPGLAPAWLSLGRCDWPGQALTLDGLAMLDLNLALAGLSRLRTSLLQALALVMSGLSLALALALVNLAMILDGLG